MLKTLARKSRRLSQRVLGREARWQVYKRLFATLTLTTKQGVFTVSTKDDAIAMQLFCRQEYELSTIRGAFDTLIKNRLLPTDTTGTLLDVGANCGVISIGVLTHGLLRRAIAIEPEPANFALLSQNILQNGLEERIIPLRCAISDQPGKVEFELSPDNLGDHRIRTPGRKDSLPEMFGESRRSVIQVDAQRLDTALAPLPEDLTRNITLAWMDIQGYEGRALSGAEALFARRIPLVSEMWPYGILKSGLSRQDYSAAVKRYWTSVWIPRQGQFLRYSIDALESFWDELGETGGYDNVIFTS